MATQGLRLRRYTPLPSCSTNTSHTTDLGQFGHSPNVYQSLINAKVGNCDTVYRKLDDDVGTAIHSQAILGKATISTDVDGLDFVMEACHSQRRGRYLE